MREAMMNNADSKKLGRDGEDLVAGYLLSRGHTVIERNCRAGHLETDLITLSSDGLHFVEVKTRCHSVQAPPQENVGKKKQDRMVRAALAYMSGERGRMFHDLDCHLDVAAVLWSEDGTLKRIHYIPDAVIPIYW